MKVLIRVSSALIAIGFVLPLWSALDMVSFVQPERAQIAAGELSQLFSYENVVHEAGFARFTLSIVALLILFIPYQRGERWAFAALMIFAVAYYVPVFLFGAIPNLGTWAVFRNFSQPSSANLAWEMWTVYAFTAFLLLGLAMSAPLFFRKESL